MLITEQEIIQLLAHQRNNPDFELKVPVDNSSIPTLDDLAKQGFFDNVKAGSWDEIWSDS